MFENMTEGQARREILEAVAEYAKKFHEQKKEFHEGDRIPYASRVYDHAEMVNLVDSALEFWLTSGRYTEEFEKKLADYTRSRVCSLVNSGSLGEFDRVYGADFAAFGRQADPPRRRGYYRGGRIPDDGDAGDPVWSGAGICGCCDPPV